MSKLHTPWIKGIDLIFKVLITLKMDTTSADI